MANWISSKLKVAETFLQQIDQQAADSLGKSDKPRSDEPNLDTPAKSGGIVPLKDQLKKKTQENNDYVGKFSSDTNLNSLINQDREKEIVNTPKPSPKPKNTLTDSDWTELLSTPNKPTTSVANRGNGLSGIHGLRKNGGRQGSWGSNLSMAEVKRNQRSNNGVFRSGRRLDGGLGSKLNGKPSDGEESGSSDSVGRTSSVDLHSDGKYSKVKELGLPDAGTEQVVKPKDEGNKENGSHFDSKDLSLEGVSRFINKNPSLETVSPAGKVDGLSDIKIGVDDVHNLFKSTIKGKHGSNQAFAGSISDGLKRGSSSGSDRGSDSDTDSGSTSDSENEPEREKRRQRREKILAEKAAARAVEAIKERENMVARLEGEKQSLEKILEERAKQQAQEASELQTTMMETMEAVDLEKQKHNNTRMEAFARLAKLETANADLARSLATAQWNLEEEINNVAELRQQIELKEIAREELRRRIFSTHQTGTSLNQLAASKGVEIEREILEAEYSFITDKIGRLQDKEKKLETDIEMTRKEIEDPTEVEIELKRRLGQLTDHLIQKQAQVESLSSEKATLLFRIEAVSRLLEENNFSGTSSRDLESGAWEFSNSKLRPMFEDRIRSGRKHLGSLVGQLDAIFLAGAVFLRRNSAAKLWSLVYLVCLHFWVIYILMSHSQPSNELRSGAVISLENINNTAGA